MITMFAAQAWMARHRLSYSFTTTVGGKRYVSDLSPRDRWTLCRKLLTAEPSEETESNRSGGGGGGGIGGGGGSEGGGGGGGGGDGVDGTGKSNGSRPVLKAQHAGVTVTVRFNLRIDDAQKAAVSAAGVPPLWDDDYTRS